MYTICVCHHLVVQHEQYSTADANISRPLHLKSISLLSRGCSVPLETRQRHFNNWQMAQKWQYNWSSGQYISILSLKNLTSTKWLSGPYKSLSNSITKDLKKEENFLFCLVASYLDTALWDREKHSEFSEITNNKEFDLKACEMTESRLRLQEVVPPHATPKMQRFLRRPLHPVWQGWRCWR